MPLENAESGTFIVNMYDVEKARQHFDGRVEVGVRYKGDYDELGEVIQDEGNDEEQPETLVAPHAVMEIEQHEVWSLRLRSRFRLEHDGQRFSFRFFHFLQDGRNRSDAVGGSDWQTCAGASENRPLCCKDASLRRSPGPVKHCLLLLVHGFKRGLD